MDKIKKFFEKKKADTKFKLAGNNIMINIILEDLMKTCFFRRRA